jgi:hypothetical protein
MATLLDVKNYVAWQRNNTDGATPDSTRDGLINEAFKEVYNARRWTWLKKKATLTISSNEASMPVDYNKLYEPIEIWNYDSTDTTAKNAFTQVDISDLSSYASDANVYAIDHENSKILFKTLETSVFMNYTSQFTDYALDGTQDSSVLLIPNYDAVKYLALSMYWMSQERATGKQQLYFDNYQRALSQLKKQDRVVGVRYIRHPLRNKALGFNEV